MQQIIQVVIPKEYHPNMTCREFAKLINKSTRTVERMVERGELPIQPFTKGRKYGRKINGAKFYLDTLCQTV